MVRFQSSTHFKLIWLLFGAKIPKIHHLFDPYKLIDSNAASIYKIGQEHAQLQEANKTSWRQVRPSVTHLCNNRERYRKSSRSPATRRVYTSTFRAPQRNGATQTHLPPRPRKSAGHCDITDDGDNFAARSAHTLEAILSHDAGIPLISDTPRLHQRVSCSPMARSHGNAFSTKAAQIRMVLRHHERNSPHGLPTH